MHRASVAPLLRADRAGPGNLRPMDLDIGRWLIISVGVSLLFLGCDLGSPRLRAVGWQKRAPSSALP